MSAVTDEIGSNRSAAQLRTGALGLVEIIGQSLAAIAPLPPTATLSVPTTFVTDNAEPATAVVPL